jgi:flagellar basal-body rod protein FlgF
MERGLYIAASGMLAEMVRQDQIANDLANASTPGYLSDRATQRSFGDVLLQNSSNGQVIGPLGMGAEIDSVHIDRDAGPIRPTGEPLDFAIQGEGFFAVRTPQGVRYTRNGQFARGADGTLQTADGMQVLGSNGQPVRVPANGQVQGSRLGVFTLQNLRKQGDTLVAGTATAGGGTVQQGALEGSNADPVRSMVDMISSFRAFESGQRVLTTIDETLNRAANQVANPHGG